MPLSKDDKIAIQEMIRVGIKEAEAERHWLRPAVLVGEKGDAETEYVPTRAKTKEIAEERAKAAVDAFKEDLPKWYEVNRRLDSASALVVVLVAIAGAIYQLVQSDQGGVRNLIHWAVGTDAKVEEVLNAEKEDWATDKAFQAATDSAFNRWADAPPPEENPLPGTVRRVLEANPVLIFEGQTTFFLADPVNQDCVEFNLQIANLLTTPETVASDDGSLSPGQSNQATAIDQSQVSKACWNGAAVALDAPLDVPFFARVYDYEAVGPADDVFVVLVENRVPKGSTDGVNAASRQDGGPLGLCVTYTTKNPQFRVDGVPSARLSLAEVMVESGAGSGFWQVNISDAIEPYRGDQPPAFHLEQVLHSVNVRPIANPSDLVGSEECTGVTPVSDQVISVRVLVFVNKDVDNR